MTDNMEVTCEVGGFFATAKNLTAVDRFTDWLLKSSA